VNSFDGPAVNIWRTKYTRAGLANGYKTDWAIERSDLRDATQLSSLTNGRCRMHGDGPFRAPVSVAADGRLTPGVDNRHRRRYQAPGRKSLETTFKPARALAAKTLAALVLAAPAFAQTGGDLNPAPVPLNTSPASEPAERFVAGVIPNANFIASASRMASTYSASDKLRNLASPRAKLPLPIR
jgi:hypothetical protein